MYDLIANLSSANAPSGCEAEVIRIISSRLCELDVKHSFYPSGNVIAHLSSAKVDAPRIMVQCHMDEVGFMVKGFKDGGYMSLSPLGISDATQLIGKRVTVLADTHYRGSIGAVPIHLSRNKDEPQIDDAYADLGFNSKSEAEVCIPLGAFGCFDNTPKHFGTNASFISGKALSSRVPCGVLLEVIRRLKDDELNADVYFAFTVRGNLSLCGATEAYGKIRPDVVISVTGTPTLDAPDSDSPICRFGQGIALSRGEVRYRYDEAVAAQLIEAAKSNGISTQTARPMTEDEDASHDVFRMKNAGARITAVKLPVRNIRSSCEVVAKADVRACLDLLCTALPRLDV